MHSPSLPFQNDDERALLGSAAIVGKPVADVTVEKAIFVTRGLLACKMPVCSDQRRHEQMHQIKCPARVVTLATTATVQLAATMPTRHVRAGQAALSAPVALRGARRGRRQAGVNGHLLVHGGRLATALCRRRGARLLRVGRMRRCGWRSHFRIGHCRLLCRCRQALLHRRRNVHVCGEWRSRSQW